MLFDPKWEVKADPFSVESLVAWLEKQPTGKTYEYSSCRHCLLSQYFTAMGFKSVNMRGFAFMHIVSEGRKYERLPEYFNEIAMGYGYGGQRTFGEALNRARQALRK